jgi:antitoxin YefM
MAFMYNYLYMNHMPYSRARQHLARLMDKVCDDSAPVVVTRRNGRSVVMMSLDEYHAIDETLHLTSSPRNARRLLRSIAQANTGKLKRHRLPIK